MARPIILIMGAGRRTGLAIATRFYEAGFEPVMVSRQGNATGRFKAIKADLSDVKSVGKIFEEVRREGEPQVVIHNAFGLSPTPADDPFSVDPVSFSKDITVNTTSLYAAIHEALKSFQNLGTGTYGTFIYTGNALNTGIIAPQLLPLGTGKIAGSYLIQTAAEVYGSKGSRFYFTDERSRDGSPIGEKLNGDAHADLYLYLATVPEQKPWLQTFVKGQGYVKF